MIFNKFLQFLFFRQWNQVHEYASQKGVTIFGDLPYYLAFDSCDVWSSDGIFELDENRNSRHVGGAPLYDWDSLKVNISVVLKMPSMIIFYKQPLNLKHNGV